MGLKQESFVMNDMFLVTVEVVTAVLLRIQVLGDVTLTVGEWFLMFL
jgi:hypothetical protein